MKDITSTSQSAGPYFIQSTVKTGNSTTFYVDQSVINSYVGKGKKTKNSSAKSK